MSPANTQSCSMLSQIASLSRDELTDRLLHFEGKCRLDFTRPFLDRKSTAELRHILLAACKYIAHEH